MKLPPALAIERNTWSARCHFCGGPSFAWMTVDATWAKVEPLLGQSQACFECFGAAWMLLGHNNGEPFTVAESAPITSPEDSPSPEGTT